MRCWCGCSARSAPACGNSVDRTPWDDADNANGHGLLALAIGNGPDLYSRHGTRPVTYTYADYAAK